PEWAALFDQGQGARVGADAFQITLTLRQGYLDPLSLMDFKILPESVTRMNDAEFAKAPTGSGPFRFSPQKSKSGKEVVFVANPYYEVRPGKTGQPYIREIHFIHSTNPRNDFEKGLLHLLLDLPTRRYKELKSAGVPNVHAYTQRNRRIHFLA